MAKKYKYQKYFTHDGVTYKVRGDTMEEVYTKKAMKIRDLDEGKIIIDRNMFLKDWVPMCIDTYKTNLSDQARKNMTYRINKHLISALGNYRLKDIKPLQLQAILNKQAGKSKSHIRSLSQEIKFIFERALDNHLVTENPAKNLTMPNYVSGKRRSLTDYERDHFLRVCEADKSFNLFLLMFYCGCRPGEAIGAIGHDISHRDGVNLLHIRGTKTAAADRIVPIPAVFYPRIKNTAPFDPISPNASGTAHSESSYDRLVARLKREMNISMGCKVYRNELIPPFPLADDFVPYDLRHTYCTDLARRGVDIRTAQKLMGHSSIQMTADIYTHVDDSQIIAAAKLIDAI